MKTIGQSSVIRSEYTANLALQSKDWRAALAPRQPTTLTRRHARALRKVRRPARLPLPVAAIAAIWSAIASFLA